MTKWILCEGASCNGGFSAEQRTQQFLPLSQTTMFSEASKRSARQKVTAGLKYTPHKPSEKDGLKFACDRCGHERVYGGRRF